MFPQTPPSSRLSTIRSALGSLIICLTLVGFSSSAIAERFENTLTGSVLSTFGNAPGQFGVTPGAAVTVVLGVESNTSGTPGSPGVSYLGAITDLTVTVGSLTATLDPADLLNLIIVANNVGSPIAVDLYSVSTFMTLPAAFGAGANIALTMSEFGSSAISSDAVAQDLSAFDAGSFALGGANGSFTVTLNEGNGGGGGNDQVKIQQTCLGGQISAGAALCKSVLACYAKQAKAPAKDPMGTVLAACLEKTEAKFASSFDKATNTATRKGGQCLSAETGFEAVLSLDDDVDQLAALIEAGADPSSKDDAKLRAALYKAGSKMVASILKAEAKEVKKPNAAKLQKAVDKAEAGVAKAVGKATAKAAAKGIATSITAQDVIDAVDELVDAVLDVAEGVE